jgi:lysophospholipase L1-like esterase
VRLQRTGDRRATAGVVVTLAVLCAACGPVRHGTPHTTSGSAPAASAAAAVRVVGLGDSVTAGTACGCQDFVQLYATGLAARWHRVVHESNLGTAGLTSAGLLAQLQRDPAVRSQVAPATVVLVTIGANDLVPALRAWDDGSGQDEATCGGACDNENLQRVAAHVREALRDVRQLQGGRRTLMLVTTYWNVFEDGDVGDKDYGKAFHPWSDAVTKSANAQICAAAEVAADTCVDIYTPFEGAGERNPTDLLAGDGDHPNAAGHELIAEALLQAEPLDPTS